jgi:hypothetical protein
MDEHLQNMGMASSYVAMSPRNSGGPYQPQNSVGQIDVMASGGYVSSLRTVLTGDRDTRC